MVDPETVKALVEQAKEDLNSQNPTYAEVCSILGFRCSEQATLGYVVGWLHRHSCEDPRYDDTVFESHSYRRGKEAGLKEKGLQNLEPLSD